MGADRNGGDWNRQYRDLRHRHGVHGFRNDGDNNPNLIAINLSQTLPAALSASAFPTLPLTSAVDPRVGPSDYISLVTETATRTATVVHFVNGSFVTVSSGPLP
jgi:hypothetical protein